MSEQRLTARNLTPLLLGLTLNPINSSVIATALVPIGDAFHATAAETAWLIAALYLATAVGQPLMGRLADIYGAVPVFYTGLILTSLAGIGGSFAGSLDVLIAWRVLLGLGTSAAYPAAMILLRRFASDDRGRLHGPALSAVTVAGQVSIVIGPTLGGLLVLAGGWRATIVAVVPVALIAGILGAFWLPRGTTPRGRRASLRQVDFAGIATFAAGLTLTLVVLLHPKSASIAVIAGAVVCFAIWAAIEFRSGAPFIDVRMLAHNLRLVAVYGRYVIIYTIFYSIFYGFPQWLEESHRSTPAEAGLFMLPTSLVAIGCAMIAPRLRPKRALLIGCTGALVGAFFLRQLHAESTAYAIAGVNAIFGVPNGMNPVSEQATLAMHADVRHMGVASGLLRTAGYIGAMLASSLIAMTFSAGANDQSLQHLATVLVGLAGVLVLIAGGRALRPSLE
ncbi:MAG: MFS transporter [Candidatus Eremiobacteraeota bacterium]|nr:MFS transporter [Candidatus Eremiobacteraeota bacterium]